MSDMKDHFDALRDIRKDEHATWKINNTDLITKSGIHHRSVNMDESLLFREPGKPKVDFYPSTGRWRVAGVKRTFSGGAQAFLTWYTKQRT